MNNTAVIIGTYNRAHLLRRSLLHYPDVDIHLYDDSSNDNTKDVFESFVAERPFNIFSYNYVSNNKSGWRDSSTYLNAGIREALKYGYKYIFITHPEIIPGKTTIQNAVRLAVDRETWISAKGYYLTIEQQAALADDADVSKLPNFYGQSVSAEFQHLKDYLPENVENMKVWHSWIFGGGSADMWRYFGGLTPFEHWGSVDVDLNDRRRVAGMKTVTPGEKTDIVIHQNHDDPAINTITPRNMDLCMKSLFTYTTKSECLKPQLLQ